MYVCYRKLSLSQHRRWAGGAESAFAETYCEVITKVRVKVSDSPHQGSE